jgi:hypothetical protein
MKRFILILCATICSAVALTGCGGGGGGGGTAPPVPPVATVATTKMYLFGTMSSASTGGSAGIMDSINTTISALPTGVTITSIVHSGSAAAMPVITDITPMADLSGVNRDLVISLVNSNHSPVVADTTSNAGKGVEVATLSFSLTGGATPSIPSPGSATTVFQYRTDPTNGPSVKELGGCIIHFETTYH